MTIEYLIFLCLAIEAYYLYYKRLYIFQESIFSLERQPMKHLIIEGIYIFSIFIFLITDLWPWALGILTLMIFRNILLFDFYKNHSWIRIADIIIRVILFSIMLKLQVYGS